MLQTENEQYVQEVEFLKRSREDEQSRAKVAASGCGEA